VRDAIVVVEGMLRYDEFIDDWRINAKKITPIDELREREARRLTIRLPAGGGDGRQLARLEESCVPGAAGAARSRLHYIGSDARGTLSLRGVVGEADPQAPRRSRRLVGRDGHPAGLRARARTDPSYTGGMPLQFLDFEQPIRRARGEDRGAALPRRGLGPQHGRRDREAAAKARTLTGSIFASLTPWQITQLARHPQRPYTLDYVPLIFTEFQELHGDRMYADDQSIVGGVARLDGRAVMVIGQQKGR
jgi:hypothetical protein